MVPSFGSCSRVQARLHAIRTLVSVMALAVLLVPMAARAQLFRLTDVGTLPGYTSSEAYGININGKVVGVAYNVGGGSHAFLWDNGVITDLGTLVGHTKSAALAINGLGQVVGWSESAGGQRHAFLWDSGVMTDLGTLGGNNSTATGINDLGVIVGSAQTGTGERHAFRYTNGVMNDLGVLIDGTHSDAYAINGSGDVAGTSETTGGAQPAFLWSSGVLSDISGADATAYGINDFTKVVGWLSTTGTATQWDGGVTTDLGALTGPSGSAVGSTAYGINSIGQVVGTAFITPPLQSRSDYASIWNDLSIRDLNAHLDASTTWVLKSAQAINDNGLIVGYGTFNGNARAFLLTPENDTIITVASVTAYYNRPTTLTAVLKRAQDNAAIANKTVSFSIDGTWLADVTTDGSGTATWHGTLPLSYFPSTYTINAAFAGDMDYNSNSGDGTLTIAEAPTFTYANAASGAPGSTIELVGALQANGAPLSGFTLDYTVDGVSVGSALTGANGVARLSYAIPSNTSLGSHPLVISFAGDGSFLPSSRNQTLTVAKPASVIYVNALTGYPGQSVTIIASLWASGAKLSNRTLSFSVDSSSIGTAQTGSNGVASMNYTIPSNAALGSHSIVVSFAGDASVLAGSRTQTLTVAKTPTVSYGNAASGKRSQTIVLVGSLWANGAKLPNKPMGFSVDGANVGTAQTDSNGVARLNYTIPANATLGNHAMVISYGGSAAYKSSSVGKTLTVNP